VYAVMDHRECGRQKYMWIFPSSALFHCLNKFSMIRGTIDIVLWIMKKIDKQVVQLWLAVFPVNKLKPQILA
jgi:hypothetical protein